MHPPSDDEPLPRVWHPFTQQRGFRAVGEVVRARGAWLHLADGRRLWDGIASWWVNPHGHSHPHVVEAMTRQIAAFDQVILADFDHAPAVRLTERVRALLPGDLGHVFFSDDGSTAVEVALKLAWQAQHQSGETQRTRFVAFEGAYHGDTLGAMRVGARDVFSAPFDPLLPPTTYLPWDDPEAAEALFAAEGHEIAALVVEPLLQGANGMRLGRAEALARTVRAAQDAGVLVIADEIATGFWRLGTCFAFEQAGVVPDVVCLGKGLTAGAVTMSLTVCTDRLYRTFLGDDKRTAFLHGHSYTGNPIACAAANASLDLFEQEDMPARLAGFEAAYAAVAERFRAVEGVEDVRWRGSLFACDVTGGPRGYLNPVGVEVQRRALAHGLYVRPLGPVVYLYPPLSVPPEELAWALDVLAGVLEELAAT